MCKPWKALVGILVLCGAWATTVQAAPYVPGEIIVKYKDNSIRTLSSMNTLYEKAGVEQVHYYSGVMNNFEQLTLYRGVKIDQAISRLQADPSVEYAQPNYLVFIPEFKSQYRAKVQEIARLDETGLPCIPGIIEPPMCDPNEGGGSMPCFIPGIPFPPGCDDSGGGGGPGNPPAQRPALKEPPAEVNPPVADPDNSKAWGLAKIQAPDAWAIHKGSKDMLVAVLDTGIDYNHADLGFNVWRNPNPTQNDVAGFDFIHNDGLPYDDQGHGTHVSGTIGAVGENGVAVSGVSPRVSIMGLKFLSSSGSGTMADAIKAIDYAIKNGAKILSNSWGGRGLGSDQALRDAITRAEQAGILFVAAAGNDGANNDSSYSASYPAAFEHESILAVAASDSNDGMASFSNFGSKSTDLAAPGVNVYSLAPGDKYATHSGTSMACPHASGAAALVWSAHPNWTAKQVKKALMETVDRGSAFSGKMISGGRLNVLKALQYQQ